MPTVTWDASFEAAPADSDLEKYGASKLRELKTAISERLELEMNFKTGTQPLLKAGKAAVLYVGTTSQINALTSMSAGAYAFDTTLGVFKYYTGAAWLALSITHAQLASLSADDHPQYLNLTKVGQTVTQDLSMTAGKKIDGRDISVDGATLDTAVANITALQNATAFSAVLSSGAIANGTVYRNTTGKPVYVAAWSLLHASKSLTALIGSVNPPLITADYLVNTTTGGPGTLGVKFIVPNNFYWSVTSSDTSAITATQVG